MFLAPIGVLGVMTDDEHGDLAVAAASAHTGVPMVASTLVQDPMEDVAAAGGDARFLQLYTPNDRELAESFVAPRRGVRLHRGSSSPSTRGPSAPGPRDLAVRPPFRSCAGYYWPTTSPTRVPVPAGGAAESDPVPQPFQWALHLRQPHPDLGRPGLAPRP